MLVLPVNGGKGRSGLAIETSSLQTVFGLTPPRSQLALRQTHTWPVNLFHLIARESGVIFSQLPLAQSDSRFFSGSYRNWRRHFSLPTDRSAQQGGSVEWHWPIKHSALSPDNLQSVCWGIAKVPISSHLSIASTFGAEETAPNVTALQWPFEMR